MRTITSQCIRPGRGPALSLLLASAILYGAAESARAQNGTWANLDGGSWATPANWSNNIIASGSGNTADFSKLTLTANVTVTLDETNTIGKLLFSDVGNSYTWELDPGSGGMLTLNSGASTPVISVLDQNATLTLSLAGTNGLTKSGSGLLALSGANTYANGTTISAGALQLNSATAASSGLITLNDANTGTNNTTVNIDNASVTNAITVANQGTGASTIAYLVSGSAISYASAATFTLNENATITAPNLTSGSYLIFDPVVAGSGNLAVTNTAGARFLLNATGGWPSFTGNIDIQNAAIFEPRNILLNNPNVTVETGGELRIQFDTASINVLTGPGVVDDVSGAATIIVGAGNGSGTFTGVLENNPDVLSFTKSGTGTQVLTGANTYTGATAVSGGTLEVDGSLGTTAVTVSTDAILDGSGSLGGTVTVNGGEVTGTLTLTAATLIENGGILEGAVTVNATTTVQSGGILEGTGAMNGETLILSGGTLAAGSASALGTLSFSQPLLFNASATNYMRISKTGGTLKSDQVSGGTSLLYNGTLVVTNATSDSTALAAGNTFTLFPNWSAYNGGFSTYLLPTLPTGLSWDFSQLTVNGSITVVNSAGKPIFTPPAGGYLGAQSVTISSLTPGAVIYYTTNGTTATTGSTLYSGPITVPVNTTETINAIATAAGYNNSADVSATYVVAAMTAVWTNYSTTPASWTVANNWSNGIIANGAGFTADFSQLTLVQAMDVTLDGSWTIGDLIFGDKGNNNTWEIDPGAGGTLTLATGGTTPVITVLNQTTTITAPISAGTNGLLKNGAGMLTLSGANTYTGGTTISVGTLELNSGTAAGPSTSLITLNDGNTGTNNTSLEINSTAVANSITVANQGTGTPTIAYVVPGSGQVYPSSGQITLNEATIFTAPNVTAYVIFEPAVGGSGNLTLSNTDNARFLLAGAPWSSYTGNIDILSGSIFEPRQELNGSNNVTVEGGGTMEIQFSTGTINGLFGSGLVEALYSAGTLVVGAANGSGTFSGTLENNGSVLTVTKAGTGTEILTGSANNYTGATTVSGGTLEVDGYLSSGTLVSVLSGATLDGVGYVQGGANIENGATVAVNTATGPSAVVGTFNISALTLNARSTSFLRITKTGGNAGSDTISGTGAAPLAFAGTLVVTNITSGSTALALGDTFTLFTSWSSYSGNFTTIVLPALQGALSWDISQLSVNGSIVVSNVVGTPTFNPPSGTYVGAQTVTISSTTPGATIYYTINGTTPTTNSTSGITPVTVTVPVSATTTTIKAYAHKSGQTDSGVVTATYTVPEAVAIWTNVFGTSWDVGANWTNNLIPNNNGATADFSQLVLPAPMDITLDGSWVVGNLIFGDEGNSNTWEIDAGNNGLLTLIAGTNAPNINVINQATLITAPIAGGTGFKKSGVGTLSLGGVNTYTGGTTVSQGTLDVVNVSSAGADLITLGASDTGTNNVQLILNANVANGINVSSNGSGTPTIDYAITGGFEYIGPMNLRRPTTIVTTNTAEADLWGSLTGNVGTLTLNASNSTVFIGGPILGYPNTFSGAIILANGTLISQGGCLGTANPLIMQNTNDVFYLANAYDLTAGVGTITTLGSLSGSGTILCSYASTGGNTSGLGWLSVGNDNGSGAFSGTIEDGAAQMNVIKAGTGTETLSGLSTYSGTTTVTNGTLEVDGALSGAGAVTVNASGTLDGSGTIAGATTVLSGGTLAAGNPATIGTLTIANAVTLNAGSAASLKIEAATNDSLAGLSTLTYGGTLTVTSLGGTPALGNAYTLFSATAYSGNFAATNLPALPAGLAWKWTPTTGTLSVVAGSTPPVLSGTASYKGTSFMLTFSGTNGQNYTVLMTTNLALPLSEWIALTNGTIGAGPVNFTNTHATNAAQFYRIASP